MEVDACDIKKKGFSKVGLDCYVLDLEMKFMN